ncbi:MAG: response regulator transcription factor [Clostridia bacterium]|nr:response regulator transcription factor [Clostridia bacterium]
MQTDKTEVLLLDDEKPSLELSRRTIANFVPETSIHCAYTVEEAMRILKTTRIDLAFLDIELQSSDGFTFCRYIQRTYPSVTVVILTGHVDFGAKSYDYEPFDFLVKPVDAMRLERTFFRYEKRRKDSGTKQLVIETSTGFAMISAEEIRYIEKNGNLCQVYCQNGQVHRVTYTLDKLETLLSGHGFFRTHQSYLVPVSKIRQVNTVKFGTSYEALLDDGGTVPVSRNKYAKLKEFILQNSMHL